eukprot:TRINITY_DN23471_c0_g1_i1.p2 TRINITY_DN23471_c0_g1~~TRINITY_DN23471_c0_g1_i1.p2  ORF type:complete len:239 (+),score=61.05 TRINITY_DN23471_c0_g1_i1:88-717(+)
MAMKRSVAFGVLCSSMAGMTLGAEASCEPGSETCQAEPAVASSMMQMKVIRHDNRGTVEKKISTRPGLALQQLGQNHTARQRVKLGAHVGDRVHITVSHKKYKEMKLKEALRKKKLGTLSKKSCDFIEAALKNSVDLKEELHEKKESMKGPDHNGLTKFEEETLEHSDVNAVDDDPEDMMTEDHEAVMRAIEEYVSSTTPEQAAANELF